MARPTWDEYWMIMAHHIATRSTCIRRQVGAVIVKDKYILSTGYNGAPAGEEHCMDNPSLCTRVNKVSGTWKEMCRSKHAESNAIGQAKKRGINLIGATMYITLQPCVHCTGECIDAGIIRIVYGKRYGDDLSYKLQKGSRLEMIYLPIET